MSCGNNNKLHNNQSLSFSREEEEGDVTLVPCRGFRRIDYYQMSDEACQETTSPTINFRIPISAQTARRGANESRPNLASLNTGNVSPNGQCACWDLIVPALNLLEPLEIAITNVCLYHRNYFSRRINWNVRTAAAVTTAQITTAAWIVVTAICAAVT